MPGLAWIMNALRIMLPRIKSSIRSASGVVIRPQLFCRQEASAPLLERPAHAVELRDRLWPAVLHNEWQRLYAALAEIERALRHAVELPGMQVEAQHRALLAICHVRDEAVHLLHQRLGGLGPIHRPLVPVALVGIMALHAQIAEVGDFQNPHPALPGPVLD